MNMNFDDQTEGSLRRILDAVVKSDTEAFDTAVRSLKQEDLVADVLELGVAVLSYAIFDTYDGKPTAADVEVIAQTVTEMEGWVNLDPAEVRKYLTGILAGKPLSEILDPQSAFFLTFIIAGSVLAASPKISEGEWWFNYLDRVEAAIETASGK